LPTPAAIEAFYRANRENFRGCAMFEASHIVKHINGQQSEEQARAGIEAALGDLENGAAFVEVVDRHSDCKDKRGDLGQFLAGTMVQEFEDAIRVLKPGQRTGIFRTPFGFHIAELRKKTAAGPLDFEEVREDIRRVLTKIEEHREYLRVVAELRTRADIRWVPDTEGQQRNCEPEKAFATT
jgi:parvulin-like peptidyl-prolyl isomerase